MIKKLNKDLIKSTKKLAKANEKAVKIYSKLNNQCSVAKSKPFAELLSAEVAAYTRLTTAANDYFKIQAEYTKKHNERNDRIIKSGAVVNLDDLQKMYALNNTIPIKNSIEIYMKSISRDSKDWKAIKTMLVELGFDVAVSNIPVVSELKGFLEQIIQAVNILTTGMKDGTNYFDLDYELYKIEIHTTIMNNAEKMFLYQANTLEDAIEFLEQDPKEHFNKIMKEQR